MAGDGGFVDTGGLDVSNIMDPSAGIGAAPPVAPTDALMPGAAPAGVPGATTDPFSPAGMTAPFGIEGGTVPEAFGADLSPAPDMTTPTFADTDAGLAGAAGGVGSAPDQGTPPPGTTTAPAATTPATAAPATDKTADRLPSAASTAARAAGPAGVGGGGANAVQSFANSLNGLARAAQGGNPQAQQLMNMIRQMMMQQQMQGMFGQGSQYNPYMNQFLDPRQLARMRMEHMRRRFLERQILAGQRGTAAGMNPPAKGGRRGR